MIPEVIISMLACARIGAPHSVVFAAFSGESLATRIGNANSRILITCDGYSRRGKVVEQKNKVDEDIQSCKIVGKVIVVRNKDNEVEMKEGRDLWWHEVIEKADTSCEPEDMDPEDELRGDVIYCYVTLKSGVKESEDIKKELRKYVERNIGPFARPKQIIFADDLPKTRNGKIMRRVLKAIANENDPGNLTTLKDPDVARILNEKTNNLKT